MESDVFLSYLDERIHKYDLLCHPFYKAWAAGELTRDDLREFAEDYYHQVEAFPSYLAEFSIRLEEGELRRSVLASLMREKGGEEALGEPEHRHAELWLDFVEGMGGRRRPNRQPVRGIRDLVAWFHRVAGEGTPEEALAAFYVYASQIPRVAEEGDRSLREIYNASADTRAYFTLHTTSDVHRAQVWRRQLEQRIRANPQAAGKALVATEEAAQALWKALDSVEARRQKRLAA